LSVPFWIDRSRTPNADATSTSASFHLAQQSAHVRHIRRKRLDAFAGLVLSDSSMTSNFSSKSANSFSCADVDAMVARSPCFLPVFDAYPLLLRVAETC